MSNCNNDCEKCKVEDFCGYSVDTLGYAEFSRLVAEHDAKIRADVLREHQEQCEGKCFKCEVGAGFINSDGEEVILPYSYSYKTDCEDMRYIKATEVKFLLDRCRADAFDECKSIVMQTLDNEMLVDTLLLRMNELKEQKSV